MKYIYDDTYVSYMYTYVNNSYPRMIFILSVCVFLILKFSTVNMCYCIKLKIVLKKLRAIQHVQLFHL